MLILNFALVPAIVQMVIKNEGFKYAGVMIYVMAAYAFYKLGISIYNLFKVKKQSNFVIAAIKNISFADALVSILALQTALLQTFLQEGSPRLFNALTGGMVSIGVISIGIYMIVNATCKLNKIVEKNKDVEV